MPILLVVTNNFSDGELATASAHLTKNDITLKGFLTAGFTKQQGLIPEARYLFITPADSVTFYAAFATEDAKLRLVSKVSVAAGKNHLDEQNLRDNALTNFLNDVLSQYMIFSESDSHYQEIDSA